MILFSNDALNWYEVSVQCHKNIFKLQIFKNNNNNIRFHKNIKNCWQQRTDLNTNN